MFADSLPFVSIIIVNYNGKHFLSECFNSLMSLDYPSDKFEIILVDNASSDRSVEYTQENFSNIKIIKMDKNYGFCKPNNEAAKIAKGKYLVFLNNDTVVTQLWLYELVKAALENENVISCASKMLYYDRKDTINTAGGKITIIGGGFYRGYGDKDNEKYNKFEFTSFGCGAGVLVEKDFFLNTGGFDEDYFAACEEHDLGWRIWLCGYKVLYVPTAVMYHKESGTFGTKSSFNPYKVYLITRNRLYNVIKNFEIINLLRGFIISIAFDFYRSFIYILKKNFESIISILNAYLDCFRNIDKILQKRRTIQKHRVRSDKDLYKLGVIATLTESIMEEKRLSKVWKSDFYKN